MVWWLLAFVCLIVAMVVIVARTESLSAEHKRLLTQYKMLDQETVQCQQFTYELAEEFSQCLLLQLNSARRMTRIAEEELRLFELSVQLIPLLCKEMSGRRLAFKPALQRALKMQADQELAELEALFSRHGRLLNGWQKQSFTGYLQMCQQMCLLVREFSHKEQLRPVSGAALV